MPAPTIHLVFKTHLDIGFTDHAARVREQYHRRFIPQALDTAEHFYREDPENPKFVWTTGAWLIWDHLATQGPAAVARLERAIGLGLIRWHALPFTTHSELMSPELFRAGLSFAGELDRRFGRTTIAAKMTDVPGHTRGIVPLLAEAGVKFLHLGVNTASPPPDVPEIFRWRAPGAEEIVVAYQKSYGATCFPSGLAEGLSFAHTSDNMGPQSVPQTVEAYRQLQHQYPDAAIRASSLDAFAEIAWTRREDFPIVDLELGDSWIHGSAADPVKTQRFLALQRLYDRFATEGLSASRLAFGRGLTLVAEHTCGVDIKTYLRDETAWDRKPFEAMRKSDFRFAYTEASWAEQRAYLDTAINELDARDRRAAVAELEGLSPRPTHGAPVDGLVHSVGGTQVHFDRTSGDIAAIALSNGVILRGLGGSLIGYRYESYDEADVQAHLDSYLTHRADWAILDHAKPGLEGARTRRSERFVPRLAGMERNGETIIATLEMPPVAREQLGAPEGVQLLVSPAGEGLEIVLQFRGKPANRMPEASFLTLTPEGARAWDYLKMGLWQPGDRMATHGGGQLQAVTAVRGHLPMGGLAVRPLDTPLVAPAGSPFMPYNPAVPDLSSGVRFNLHNNKWGTNFPMWWEGDFRARFVLTVG